MGCVFSAKNNIIKNEISLTPLPNNSIRKIKTDSYAVGLEDTDNSKRANNNNERINNFSSLNFGPIKYKIKLKNGKEMEILQQQLNKLLGLIKGFLFRKKFEVYLKIQLMDYTNELYFEFIILTKNYQSSKILNNKNEKIRNILKTSWEEYYIKDPTTILKERMSKIKKYPNGLIFKYKNKNFKGSDINQCLQNALSCYKGSVDIINNKKNGIGELINIDGTQKIGTFYNDEFCGWNTLVNNNGIIYIGLFHNNILNGKGLCYNPSNSYMYKGDFKNFKKDGYGEEIFNGYKYKGDFDQDIKNGKGEIILKNNDIYKGGFLNDKFNGEGKYIWYNKNKEYLGNFVDNKMHGFGLLKWGNGMYYKGLFNNGMKEGRGEFGYINKLKFFFDFKNDLPNGKGYIQDKNNNLFEVIYNQGKIIGNNIKEIIFLFE